MDLLPQVTLWPLLLTSLGYDPLLFYQKNRSRCWMLTERCKDRTKVLDEACKHTVPPQQGSRVQHNGSLSLGRRDVLLLGDGSLGAIK